MPQTNSKQLPFTKFLGKLRALIAVVPESDAPRRSWERASAREIQLELDFGRRERIYKVIKPKHDRSGQNK